MYALDPRRTLYTLLASSFTSTYNYLILFFVRDQGMASACRRLFFSLYGQTNLKSNKHILSNQTILFFRTIPMVKPVPAMYPLACISFAFSQLQHARCPSLFITLTPRPFPLSAAPIISLRFRLGFESTSSNVHHLLSSLKFVCQASRPVSS